MDVQLSHGGGLRPLNLNLRWGGIALAVTAALLLGGVTGAIGRHYLNAGEVKPLPGITKIVAQPIPTVGPGTDPTPVALPDHVLLQVPFTTQAPLNNWDRHQESCEAANLTMLYLYWNHNGSVVIDPHAADSWIGTIDAWKPAPDLNDTQVGELAKQHWGYSYRLVPNDPKVIAQQLAAGRPLLAEVRTHGLGNSHYPGYASHYEQNGWSVPHFVTIIGYDATGVWLNDPGISWGRGYHITYAQLTHAIDDLDQHHPSLSQGQVLLLVAPEATTRVRAGAI
ncbi:MAG: hypothetical protein E6I50_06105 [Chloroflexi bacterium]|nr:MAG: hypothetical protein E6I50_06105 [Chloroflexota bacterium]